jgi:hypothetical protein
LGSWALVINISDEEGIFSSRQEVFINPKIEDHGKMVNCKAVILDGDNKPVFDMIEAEEIQLNVTFPPQKMANQSLSGSAGDNMTIDFKFKSNPKPSSVKWVISIPPVVESNQYRHLRAEIAEALDLEDDGTNNTTTVVELTPGKARCLYNKVIYRGGFCVSCDVIGVKKKRNCMGTAARCHCFITY